MSQKVTLVYNSQNKMSEIILPNKTLKVEHSHKGDLLAVLREISVLGKVETVYRYERGNIIYYKDDKKGLRKCMYLGKSRDGFHMSIIHVEGAQSSIHVNDEFLVPIKM